MVEINPHVLALRDEFRAPREGARFTAPQDDGAQFVRNCGTRCDALRIDGADLGNRIALACRGHALSRLRAGAVRRPKGLDEAAANQLLAGSALIASALKDQQR